MVKISIIIPVLNEAAHLGDTLAIAANAPDIECIVVDAGSLDGTVDIAKTFDAIVVTANPGRACQMNAGAAIAQGDLLLFLHADTHLPSHYADLIPVTLAQPGIVAGAFDLKIRGTQFGLRWVEWGVYWRSRWCQLPYGDQALFLAAETFHALGGFPEVPFLEDLMLMRRLRQLGKIAIAPASVLTSGRRWQQLGVVKTTVLNQLVLIGYCLGISPRRLACWYRQVK